MKWSDAALFVVALLTYIGWKFWQAQLAPPSKHIYVMTTDKCTKEFSSRLKEYASSNDFGFETGALETVLYQGNQQSIVDRIETFNLGRWDARVSGFYDTKENDPSALKYSISLHYSGWLWPTGSKETDRLANALMSKLKSLSCVQTLELTN